MESDLSSVEELAYTRVSRKMETSDHFKATGKALYPIERALRKMVSSSRRIAGVRHEDLAKMLGEVRAVRKFWD